MCCSLAQGGLLIGLPSAEVTTTTTMIHRPPLKNPHTSGTFSTLAPAAAPKRSRLACLRGLSCPSLRTRTRHRRATARPQAASAFCAEIESIDGEKAWVVGDVVAGAKTASMAAEVTVVHVD
jgi:hypothetical protein